MRGNKKILFRLIILGLTMIVIGISEIIAAITGIEKMIVIAIVMGVYFIIIRIIAACNERRKKK